MKPLVKWSGGKEREIPQILPHLPDAYDTYVEPFIGGGALYFHLNRPKNVISDVHTDLVTFYNSIKAGHGEDIYALMRQHPNDEATYYHVRDVMECTTDVLKAFRFYYLRKTCFRGMMRYNANGKFNIPFGRYKTMNFEAVRETSYQRLLENTTVLNKGFEDIFTDYGTSDNFFFLDPPYDSKFTDYGYCKFDRKHHETLFQCFEETQAKCLMIIGDTEFIRELYRPYIVGRYEKKYAFKLLEGRVGNEINTDHLVIKNWQ